MIGFGLPRRSVRIPDMIAQATILDRFLEPFADCLTGEVARRVIDLRPDQVTQARLEVLREKANEGRLTEGEKAEYEEIVEGLDIMGILKAKARAALSKLPA